MHVECYWQGKTHVLGQKLVQWTERNWNWFLSPILSDFTLPLIPQILQSHIPFLQQRHYIFLQMTASLTRHFCPPSYEVLWDLHDSYIADLSVSLMVQSFRLQEFSSANLTSSDTLTLFDYPDFSSATITSLRLPWLRFFHAFSSVVRQMPGYDSQRRGTAHTLPN